MVRQYKKTKFNLSKLLVTYLYGHEDMLDYFSDFRTQDKMGGIHYYPKGALCWFETNQYGDLLNSVYLVRLIPDMKMVELPMTQRGLRRLKAQQNKKKTLNEILTKEKNDTEIIETIKPKLHKWKEGE